jgi:hypothetical protein
MLAKIIKAESWNWYKDLVGKNLLIRDEYKYADLGIQVWRPDGKTPAPDVIEHGHWEYSE